MVLSFRKPPDFQNGHLCVVYYLIESADHIIWKSCRKIVKMSENSLVGVRRQWSVISNCGIATDHEKLKVCSDALLHAQGFIQGWLIE